HQGVADTRLTLASAALWFDRSPPVSVGSGIRRMRQQAIDGAHPRRTPFQVPAIRPVVGTDAKADVILPQVARDGMGGSQLVELIEDQPNDSPNLLVWVQGQAARRRLDVPDRRIDDQLSATGLIQLASLQAAADRMDLQFRDLAF